MHPRIRLPLLAAALCLVASATQGLMASAAAQSMPKTMFPGAPTGVLTVRMELSGSARRDMPNGVEWYKLTALRTLDLRLTMLDPGVTNAPLVEVSGRDPKNANANAVPGMPPGMQEMAAAIEACDGDQACERAAMTKLAPKIQANPQAYDPKKSTDANRYQNWVNDRRVICAKGSLSVSDSGEGVVIPPPNPARPYKFQRIGSVALPDGKEKTIEAACIAEITFDRQTGKASLVLPAAGLAVPVKLSGQAFTNETSVAFIEGVQKIKILDQPGLTAGKPAKSWSGQTTMKIGSVSHNSGQVVVPVTAKITWRFDTLS
jgi:hypothetical protein